MKAPAPILVCVLLLAVVVAGDGAGADIRRVADLGVAQIGQVLALGAGAEAGLLQLDEIADARVFGPTCASMRRRANGPTCAPARCANRRSAVGRDDDAIGQHGGFENRSRADAAILADRGVPSRRANGSMMVSAPTRTCVSMVTVSGRSMVTPASISSSDLAAAQDAVGVGEFDARVDAQQLARIVDVHALHAVAVAVEDLRHVGEVQFAARRCWA